MQNRGTRTTVVALLVGVLTAGASLAEERYRPYRSYQGEHESTATKATAVKSTAKAEAKAAPAKPAADRHAPAESPAADGHGHAPAIKLAPADALSKLLDGNARYVNGKAQGPNRSASRRAAVAKGQSPFAVIVSCSDSRVPPEILFDQGIGDLFIVRTAGNVVDDVALGSIEYAVEHLGASLILILGHQSCGAVAATVAGGTPHGHVGSIVSMITPAVEKARSKPGDLLENSIKANVKLVSEKLRSSEPILRELMDDGTVRIVGGYYDLESGSVSMTYQPCL